MTKTIEKKEENMKSKYEEYLNTFTISDRLFKTGLTSGTIVGIQPYEDYIEFEVRIDSNRLITVTVDDTHSYNSKNELAKLLEKQNIVEGKISRLLFTEVTVQLDGLNNYEDLSSNSFSMYTGSETRKFLHNLGLPKYKNNIDKVTPIVTTIGFAVILSAIFPYILAAGFSLLFLLNFYRILRDIEVKSKEYQSI